MGAGRPANHTALTVATQPPQRERRVSIAQGAAQVHKLLLLWKLQLNPYLLHEALNNLKLYFSPE